MGLWRGSWLELGRTDAVMGKEGSGLIRGRSEGVNRDRVEKGRQGHGYVEEGASFAISSIVYTEMIELVEYLPSTEHNSKIYTKTQLIMFANQIRLNQEHILCVRTTYFHIATNPISTISTPIWGVVAQW